MTKSKERITKSKTSPKELKDSKKSKVIKPTKKEETIVPEQEFPSSDEEQVDSEQELESSDDGEAEEDEELEGFDGFESTDDEQEDKSQKQSVNEEEIKQKISVVKKQATCKKDESMSSVIYIGRIPHGFYEKQMKSYFSQFGDVARLRVSRNKKSGKSKHYGFVEFESPEIAQIVSDSMDNYLLFGHILKVKHLSKSQLHENIFKGSNKVYQTTNFIKLAKHKHDSKKSSTKIAKLESKHKSRLEKKNQALKKLGIDYSYSIPAKSEKAKVTKAKVTKSKRKSKK